MRLPRRGERVKEEGVASEWETTPSVNLQHAATGWRRKRREDERGREKGEGKGAAETARTSNTTVQSSRQRSGNDVQQRRREMRWCR